MLNGGICQSNILKRVFAKNEKEYRLILKKYSVLIATIFTSICCISRKWLKKPYTQGIRTQLNLKSFRNYKLQMQN